MVVKGGEKLELISRKQYKEIKKMDRQELETFLARIYHQGYQDGILENTKGVEPKTFDRIMKTVKEIGI